MNAVDPDFLEKITSLLADPAYQSNPLCQPLADLLEYSEQQRLRLERVLRISDGYQHLARHDKHNLLEQYDRQVRRLEKLARISDRYQNSLREVSEALKEAALHDPLTHLGNRRFLMERLREESERATRQGLPYAVGILDVDHFKRVNDQFGHELGDEVLCKIAGAIEGALREYDLCGRWGGEEFLIILPDTTISFAVPVVERVLAEIRSIRIALPGQAFGGVTASIGITAYLSGESYAQSINRADAALLAAKAAGRNRIELAVAGEPLSCDDGAVRTSRK
ncbi:MAG: biofilm regulation diguanylate cyclase SiaD [Dechloromonas sp.]|nr:biofilm regulation diguanylate cyclase SiaD [Dechloromonas sp.]